MSFPLEKKCMVMCANFNYCGTLEEVTPDRIVLRDPSIVYETGEWGGKAWLDAQRLPTDRIYLERTAVESWFEVIRP